MNRSYFPSLRGVFGKWVYYTTLLPLEDVARRVRFAEEIHKSEKLSEFIQRTLRETRAAEIANFLQTYDERFFNAMVVAVYGGSPCWNEFDNLTPHRSANIVVDDLPDSTRYSIGFLSFDGSESLFAVDGQHRLAGIRYLLETDPQNEALTDQVPVTFVAHENNKKGVERTRRLFTILNKNAKPISKGETIALDEDDVMAICVRKLVEEHDWFSGNRVLYTTVNQMPTANTESLTTIAALYDVLSILFTKASSDLKASKKKLQFKRPDREVLDAYYEFACEYFELLDRNFAELSRFFRNSDQKRVVRRNRGSFGGHILFRPIGLKMFTEIIVKMTSEYSLKESVEWAAELPVKLDELPYCDTIFQSSTGKIAPKHQTLCRDLLLHMLQEFGDTKGLSSRYGDAMGNRNKGSEYLSQLPVV